jgi:protein phosphatase
MAALVKTGQAQFIGSRGEQQDACAISDSDDIDFVQHGGVLAVVADGIGGHAFGADASEVAVAEFTRSYKGKFRRAEIPDVLYAALKKANAAVCEFAEIQGSEDNCGTTMVAAVVHPKDRALYWVSVGDSRLYLLRDGQWVQLTADGNLIHQWTKHRVRGTLAELAEEDEQEMRDNPEVLTSFLGLKRLTDIDRTLRPFPLHPGDWIVLCTDGLFKSLSQQEILACLTGTPQAAADALVRTVAAKGLKTQDNCTVTILGYRLAKQTGNPAASASFRTKNFFSLLWPASLWLRLGLIAVAAFFLIG